MGSAGEALGRRNTLGATCSIALAPDSFASSFSAVVSTPAPWMISFMMRGSWIGRADSTLLITRHASPGGGESGRCAATGDETRKVTQLVAVHVGDNPVGHAVPGKVHYVEAIARDRPLGRVAPRGPDKYVDGMLAALVHQRGDRLPADVIQAPAREHESLRRQVRHRRRKVEARAQPGLHRVLVGRRDIGQAAGQFRARVAREHILHNALVLARAQGSERNYPGDERDGSE